MHDLQALFMALRFGGVMVYPLLLLAVLAIVVLLDKAYVFWRYARVPASMVQLVETYGFTWGDLGQQIGAFGPNHYFRRFFQVIIANRDQPAWWVESRAADEASLIEKSLGRGLWVLETIVTAAPLLGLLGTITGMFGAFKLFGSQGLVNPTGVTGGVAQALVATALGLFIALLALFAFNYFSRLHAQVMDEMERLGTRLVDHIRLDQQEQEVAREAA